MTAPICCRRHRAGIPLVGDDAAIRCGDLSAEDRHALELAAEEAEARAEAATPGPWRVWPRAHESMHSAVFAACGHLIVNMGDGGLGKASQDANAALIAAAREDVPALAAALLVALEQLDAVTAERDHKVAGLAAEVTAGLERERDMRAKLAVVATDTEGVWRWQGDGHDDPASLSCPVVMSADTLRAILAERDAARVERADLTETLHEVSAACPPRGREDAAAAVRRMVAERDDIIEERDAAETERDAYRARLPSCRCGAVGTVQGLVRPEHGGRLVNGWRCAEHRDEVA